jgi:D-alanyl-D-alanine carboxypeptidase/D-alanyl-D-alanine-endopeptidase (penicillin-binding protein 4)
LCQTINQKLQKAFAEFERDEQLEHAISSLYVIDAATGKVVFDKNSQVGLAPASTQKTFTAATAFELLGKDYRYKTEFYVSTDGNEPRLTIKPSGDPTFGSWRWQQTKDDVTINRILKAIKNVNNLSPIFYIDGAGWNSESIPDGWVWQDIGNYYGAGSSVLNWRENQFDISLQSGNKIGDSVKIINTIPNLYSYKIYSLATSAAKGSGDNAYAYFPIGRSEGVVRGTIPVNEKGFVISASTPSGTNEFQEILIDSLKNIFGKPYYFSFLTYFDWPGKEKVKLIHTETSPPLDSIIYWFLKKSINLYGEALIKTFAFEKRGIGATDSGVNIVKDFWKQKGIDAGELNIYDGSGLSPLNRVTTHAQVEVLKYAKKQNWFNLFYNALPEFNNMKMKSGTISDVKAFCGYHTAKDGREYIFSFIVNNYRGLSLSLINKMYKVLNILK